MKIRSNFNLAVVIAACLCASPAVAAPTDGTTDASDTAQILQDGRTLVVMPEPQVCGTPTPNKLQVSSMQRCHCTASRSL